ncbi:hypothetical protein UFOVP1077_40 [uncultured Caudovirales phage]|uniref:Uncharacterized protein n=1 Tax=uncultured Caudovirales phage TaxID=2100421 RepID=A0A6J7X7Z5_9CAUD|nr:hypothetical protein UFOVP1077_40 [uncultured Caudovirales phage]CAB4197721.1 hypothetical protein UFOVP1316_28 [uncultured Caudovirales phage]CAB4211420.1 hypothetical protein UFOVP1428_37 [uncultured Caudovirales phage]CAB5227112.1 hypothetical protein UFOVP1526_7 [uncultured Caudovirales phage]
MTAFIFGLIIGFLIGLIWAAMARSNDVRLEDDGQMFPPPPAGKKL